ncbi:lysophospholipid acyltransferase family protein [Marinoscillum sp.]|uniref:lysophospholipid acyltransferase family protein n=1 Tax=Marinoscillum sp. TaxID=2024838 RepID=UPI003BA9FCE6
MARILYYLIIKPLSFLPMRALYVLADLLYLLMRCGLTYRKKVVFSNLSHAFPDKPDEEIRAIAWKFYRHFCDLLAESIRLFSISEKEAIARFKVVNTEVFDALAAQSRSALLVGGHYNNWELFAVATDPQISHQLLGIYTPLTNAFFEKKFSESRSKFGLILVPKKKVKETFEQFKSQLTATTFAIDQSPRKSQRVYWTKFLNQDTAVHFGAEKYAKDYNYAVVFGSARKVKRGHYELRFELLEDSPKDTPEGAITERQTRRLEAQIYEAPEYWLWTHKRWKLKKP